ncbi:tetratricopeptide repeat protein [Streptomyces sp. NPDC058457]|uniref:tetratricopeptide repeat protein n=1 Tax=Streptomyces sp. NPDC058457 TaxID=3346507 RepID=UPI003665510C
MGDGDYFDFRGGVFHGPVTGVGAATAPSSGGVSNLLGAPAVFTGRDEETQQLLNVLDPTCTSGHTTVSAVSGLPGVGKTALAMHVSHVARDQKWFPGGALFVDLHGYDETPGTADGAVLSLLRQLGVHDADTLPVPADDLYARYRRELAAREPVLIILDNAKDPAHITPLLPGEGTGHRVLITSRDVQDSLLVRQFTIDALTPDAACLLLDRSLRGRDPDDHRVLEEPDAARELTELCGRLPLALLIAVALLRRRGQRPIVTLTAELRDAADRVRALRFDGVDQYRRELTLHPVFDVMYQHLDPELARIFRLLGQAPTPHIWQATAAALADLAPNDVALLLDDLAAASLVTVDPPGSYVRMHDLVHLYAHSLSAEDPELRHEAAGARRRLLGLYDTYVLAADQCIRQVSYGEIPDVFSGSDQLALQWLSQERQSLLSAVSWTSADDPDESGRAMSLALNLCGYLIQWYYFSDGLEAAQAAHAAALALNRDEWIAQACNALGACLRGLGRGEEALEYLYRAQRAFAALNEPGQEAGAWDIIGSTLVGLERFAEAVQAHKRSLHVYAALGDRRMEANARVNYCATLIQLGRWDEAQEALVGALDIHVAIGHKVGEAAARAYLGAALQKADRAEEALEQFLKAAALYGELGNVHGQVAVWFPAAEILYEFEQFESALAIGVYLQQTSISLGDRGGEARASLHIGHSLLQLGHFSEALAAHRCAHTLYEARNDWLGVGQALLGIATDHKNLGDDAAALEAAAGAAEAYERAGNDAEATRIRSLIG